MTLYILDSDHTTLHQREDRAVVQRFATVPSDQVSVTIVTVEEQMRGWLALLRRAQTPERLIPAYASLHRAVAYFARVPILDYDEAAANLFAALRAQKIRIGTHDLRIAAIALATGGVLVTRNRSDFQPVPGLVLEDWSQPLPPL
jgi:tRNA(fMet)-specific endonuclease VapC